MRVDIVTLLKVLQHIVYVCFLTFGTHFCCSSFSSDHRLCGHEYLQLRIWKYGGAYVSSIHDYAFVLAEFSELPVHKGTDFRYSRDRADLSCYCKRSDFFLDASVSDECSAFSEMKVEIFHSFFKSRHVNCTVISYETVLDGE